MVKQLLIIAVLFSIIRISVAIARYHAAIKRVKEQKKLLKAKWEKFKTITKH